MHTKLQLHLERYMYKRGANKGDAPADSAKRGRSHHRVIKNRDGTMTVRFWNTDIITAYPDGKVEFNVGRWGSNPTTLAAMSDSLQWFHPLPISYFSERKYSKAQLVVAVGHAGVRKEYAYYNGMQFDAEGNLLTEVKPFQARRIDRTESKELHDGMKQSGFKAAFKLLHAAAKEEDRQPSGIIHTYTMRSRDIRNILTDADHADAWPEVIARYAFEHVYIYTTRGYETIKLDASKAWGRLMDAAKGDLYETVEVKAE